VPCSKTQQANLLDFLPHYPFNAEGLNIKQLGSCEYHLFKSIRLTRRGNRTQDLPTTRRTLYPTDFLEVDKSQEFLLDEGLRMSVTQQQAAANNTVQGQRTQRLATFTASFLIAHFWHFLV